MFGGKDTKLNTKKCTKRSYTNLFTMITFRWLEYVGFINITLLLLFYFVSIDLSTFSYFGVFYFWIRKMNNVIKGHGKKYSEILRMIILKWSQVRFPCFDIFFWAISIMETVSISILFKISQHINIYCIWISLCITISRRTTIFSVSILLCYHIF